MNTYKRHRFPPDIISYGVWLHYRFNLSHRDIEDLLTERGIIVSHPSISLRSIKFDAISTRRLKRKHRGDSTCPWPLRRCACAAAELIQRFPYSLALISAQKLRADVSRIRIIVIAGATLDPQFARTHKVFLHVLCILAVLSVPGCLGQV